MSPGSKDQTLKNWALSIMPEEPHCGVTEERPGLLYICLKYRNLRELHNIGIRAIHFECDLDAPTLRPDKAQCRCCMVYVHLPSTC